MYPQSSRAGFSVAVARHPVEQPMGHPWRFDLVEIATIVVGVVVMTALTVMF